MCDADAKYYYGLRPRYYQYLGFSYLYGVRSKEKFMEKYPLVPLHEAVGVVREAGKNSGYSEGDRVVLIPSIPCDDSSCPYCSAGKENCCPDSKFMSSNAPGFARDLIVMPSEGIARIPDEVDDRTAVYCELASVSYGGVLTAELNVGDTVAVFGDGYLGVITVALLSTCFNVPAERLYFFGVHDEKLDRCKEISTLVNIRKESMPEGFSPDRVIECVGKRSAEKVINTAIECVRPEGTIVLMGVSEEKVAINTRNVLSKSIALRGISRSPARNYSPVLEAMRDEKFREVIGRLFFREIDMQGEEDLKESLKEFMENRKKVFMRWKR